MKGLSLRYPLTVNAKQQLIEGYGDCDVLALMALPYTDPSDGTRFASIHSNPPGALNGYPSIIKKRVGAGCVIWAAAPIEVFGREPHERAFLEIAGLLLEKPAWFAAKTEKCVEIVALLQESRKRFIICALNAQEHMPPVKVRDIEVRLRTEGRKIASVRAVPGGEPLHYVSAGEYIEMTIPEVDIFRMISVEFY